MKSLLFVHNFSALRERKSTIKRTIQHGQHHSSTEPMLHPVVDASPDTFTISLADAAFLSRNDVQMDRIRDSSQHQQRSSISKSARDWEAIKQSVKNALTVYQQQFNNKV